MLRLPILPIVVTATSVLSGGLLAEENEEILAKFNAAGTHFVQVDSDDPFSPGEALAAFAPEKFDPSVLDLLPKVPNVTRVLLVGDNKFSRAVLERLPGLSTVTGVQLLDGGKFDDTALERLARADRLVSVKVFASRFTPEGLSKLGSLRQLKRLLIECQEGTFDLAPFGELVELRQLDLRTPRRAPGSLATLARFPRLESLTLSISLTPDEQGVQDISAVEGLADLQKVQLRGVKLKKGNVTTLAKLPRLASLDLTGCGIDGAELSALAGKKMQLLDLAGPRVPYARGCPANDVRDEHLKALEGFEVEELRLDGLPLTSAGLASVATMKSIRSLDLGFVSVDANGLEALAKLPQLRNLDLAASGEFDEAEMRTIASMPELADLNLARTKIASGGLVQLADAPKLSQLSLYSVDVDGEAVAALKQARPELTISGP